MINHSLPPVRYSFAVVFFPLGVVPNPLDIRFSKASGIGSTIETEPLEEGGENLLVHQLPKRLSYDTLKLERGMVTGSLLNLEFNLAMSSLQLHPGNVMLTLLDENSVPSAAWLYLKTYPLKWSVSELDANQNDLMIDSMELAYERFLSLRV